MRTSFIVANWKENKSNHEAAEFIRRLKQIMGDLKGAEVVICPAYVSIITAFDCTRDCNLKIGSQDVSVHEQGAYTGEVSALMLRDFCQYSIIGHSERRKHFQERNEIVNKKVQLAIKYGIRPILCIGEDAEQRKNGLTNELLFEQLQSCLENVGADMVREIVIAYEPVWAISHGDPNHRAATPDDAEKAHEFIRKTLARMYDSQTASMTRIIYGGSAKPENISSLLEKENIDGALVGTASLDPESFAEIIKASRQYPY